MIQAKIFQIFSKIAIKIAIFVKQYNIQYVILKMYLIDNINKGVNNICLISKITKRKLRPITQLQ